jgi:small GTP-binding protein
MHDSDPSGVNTPVLKVILVGNSGVGKTSLIGTFIRGAPDLNTNPTVTPAYSCHELTRNDGVTVCLQLWDTAGQERFHSISALFYREADVAVVCFEAGSQESLESVPDWVKRVKNQVPDCMIVFAGTKSDLRTEDQLVDVENEVKGALDVFQPKGYFLTSAISGKGIDCMLQHIADLRTVNIEHRPNQSVAENVPVPRADEDCC